MKIVETKEVILKRFEEVIVGRKCDICYKPIKKTHDNNYNYFQIHTWHYDWGNDSIDSHEYFDACCPGCVKSFTDEYIQKSFDNKTNSRRVQIIHKRSLEGDAYD